MQLTITGNSKAKLEQIETLAKKLGLEVIWKKDIRATKNTEKPSQRLYDLMSAKARSGGIQSIKDPVTWQREQRKDKPLPGRE